MPKEEISNKVILLGVFEQFKYKVKFSSTKTTIFQLEMCSERPYI